VGEADVEADDDAALIGLQEADEAADAKRTQ